MSKDSLGDRMKSYEGVYRTSLPIRLPVILRIDGKAFHTYTKGCKRPLDENLVNVMNETAIKLCKTVQGCQLAYVQSDEISLLLVNYQTLDTQSWFDNNVQKMVSISAAVASTTFTLSSWKIFAPPGSHELDAWMKPAHFDSRAFVVPKEDVANYFLWRQQDATRNSVQMLARTLYSHKELENKDNSELQELCFKKGLNWNDCPTSQKRGRCIVKKTSVTIRDPMMIKRKDGTFGPPPNFQYQTVRSSWEVDNEIPIFSQDRNYIEKYVYPERDGLRPGHLIGMSTNSPIYADK